MGTEAIVVEDVLIRQLLLIRLFQLTPICCDQSA